jgi:alkylation response protein AidB-like acyl-CoA dehydrogenase
VRQRDGRWLLEGDKFYSTGTLYADWIGVAAQRHNADGSGSTPREDPLVQQLIGQLASTAFSATATVRAVAASLGEIDRARLSGRPATVERLVQVELDMAKAQVAIGDAVLGSATRMFDVGGASALHEDVRLDRHWRNARTLASHNPVIYKARVVGDHALNGAQPTFYWTVGANER